MAVDEINEKLDIRISYEQLKKCRNLAGFRLKLLTKDKPKNAGINNDHNRDADTTDIFTIEGLNDEQLDNRSKDGSLK